MSSKIRDGIAVINAGASFVYTAAAFFYFGACASSIATIQKYMDKSSYYKSYYEKSLGEAYGVTIVYGVLFVASLLAAIFGVIHACNYISGKKRKSASGITSSILLIILSLIWSIIFIVGMAGGSEETSSRMAALSLLSAVWIIVMMLIAALCSLGTAIAGLIFTIGGNKGDTASNYYATAPMAGMTPAPVAQPQPTVTPQPMVAPQPMPVQQPVLQQTAPVAQPVAPAPQPVLQQQPAPQQPNNTPLF